MHNYQDFYRQMFKETCFVKLLTNLRMSQRAPELKIAALDSQSATDTRKTKIYV